MLWFTFDDFYKKFEDKYKGEHECKQKLVDAIKLIQDQKRLNSQINTLLALLKEAKPLVFKNPDEIDSDHELHKNNDNLIKSFNQRLGSPLKAAALHYLFLSNPSYKAAADIMNEELFPRKTLEEIFPKEGDGYTSQKAGSISSANNQPHWKLVTCNTTSIDAFECKVAFETRQPRRVGEEVDLFTSAVIPRSFEIANYEFSFKEVRIATSEQSDEICKFSHPLEWKTANPSKGSTTFELDDVGLNRAIKIATSNGVLEGSYIFDECHFLALKPNTKQFEFSAELLTRGKDQNISKTDGTKLPSKEKKAIIQSLALKEIGPRRDGSWVAIAKTDYKLTGDQKD